MKTNDTNIQDVTATLMLEITVQSPKRKQHKGNKKNPRKLKSIAKTKNEP